MVRRVGTVRYIVCAAPAYLAAHGEPANPDDLDHHDCVRRVAQDGTDYASWKFGRPATGGPFERSVRGTLGFDSNDAIADAGPAGGGLVRLHTCMAEPHLRVGRLVQVLGDDAVEGPPISVLFPSGRHLAQKVRAFIDFAAKLVAEDRAGREQAASSNGHRAS